MILSIIIFITLCAATFMFYIEKRTLAKKLKATEDSYALLYKKICNEVDENSRLKIEIIQKNTIIQNKNVYIVSLEQQLRARKNGSVTYLNSDIKDAVKFAMIHSHPDNGGAQDDFIKYRKLYQEMIGGNA